MNKQIHLIISYIILVSSTFASSSVATSNNDDNIEYSSRKIEFNVLEVKPSFQSDAEIFEKMTTSAKKTVYNYNYLSRLKNYFWKDSDGNIIVTE